ncbi:hypothetical protein E3N88_28948 [Mikania micrantha]|uniref:Uncharacterized protein n=1 Tax=Mikania micrantha TaxID=192012 RepID=A0A5N6N237_9ASTR|nr:hypothetical protein E3N88_28948 [Mikania micrantha]
MVAWVPIVIVVFLFYPFHREQTISWYNVMPRYRDLDACRCSERKHFIKKRLRDLFLEKTCTILFKPLQSLFPSLSLLPIDEHQAPPPPSTDLHCPPPISTAAALYRSPPDASRSIGGKGRQNPRLFDLHRTRSPPPPPCSTAVAVASSNHAVSSSTVAC